MSSLGTATASYHWQYRTSVKGTWRYCSTGGAMTASYSVKATLVRANYQCRCVVTASDGRTATTDPIAFSIK